MRLYIAGGCQEHGRNCFLIELRTYNIMVDCGVKEDKKELYPLLNQKQIERTRYLFLTHSHKDHAGAVHWLLKNGFSGKIISTEETRKQVCYPYHDWILLPMIQRRYKIDEIQVIYGRSGHCIGSIWIFLTIGTKNLLFTGDYSENSVVYTCDLIRNISADCAIIDCAYGNEEFSVPDAIQKFTALFCQIQSTQQNLLLPVPKYGRGVDLLYIIKKLYPSMKVYGDACISEQVSKKMETWYLQYSKYHIEKIENWRKGPAVLIITDPQLRENRNQMLAENIFESGGIILHTGHIYENTYADVLLKEGNAKQIIYPVHMNYGAASMLVAANHFSKVILNHSKDTVTDYTNLTKGYINRDVIMI